MLRTTTIAMLLVCALPACDGCTTAVAGEGEGEGTEGEGEGEGSEGEGEGEGEGAIDGLALIELTPTEASLSTDGTSRPEQAFSALGTFNNGTRVDVTDRVLWSVVDGSVGVMRDNVFVSNAVGGVTDVVARAGDVRASARVTVRAVTVIIGDDDGNGDGGGFPDDVADIFDGDTPVDDGRAPQLVYPNDGVLLPKNLGVIEIHWRKGSNDNTLFAVTFQSPVMEARVITRCVDLNGGCVYTPSASTWRLLADTNAGTEAVTVTVQGTDDAGTAIGNSNSIAMGFAATGVNGGLYYWTTSGSTAIMRVDFGAVEQVPEKFFPFTGNDCYGCHSLSPDGRKMSLSRRGIGQGQLGLINIVDGSEGLGFDNEDREQFQSWNGESSLFAATFADTDDLAVRHQIRVRNGDSGAVVERIDLDHEPDHPSWSPVEDRLIYTKVTHHSSSQRPGRGGINSLIKRDGAWLSPQALIEPETGKNRYSPAVSPAGEFFAYVESVCDGGREYGGECDADADPSAKLLAYSLSQSAVVDLAHANTPGITDGGANLSSTFPKWSPFEEPRFRDGSGRVNWMTFSSRRNYGLRTNDPNNGRQLLWMVAVDPDRVIAGEDGSFPAFVLPFQDINTSNHMAQWTREFVAVGCSELGTDCDPADDNACCGSAVCTDGDGDGVGTCEADDGEDPICASQGESCVRLTCCEGLLCLGEGDQQVCGSLGG